MNLLDERMPDKVNAHFVFSIKCLFKGEDNQHPVHVATDELNPFLTPGPELGRDIIDDLEASTLESLCKSEIEVWKVDEDDEVGLSLDCQLYQASEHSNESRECEDNFSESRHRDCFGRVVGLEAERPHCRAPYAIGFMAPSFVEFFNQLRAVEVSRSFACNHHDAERTLLFAHNVRPITSRKPASPIAMAGVG